MGRGMERGGTVRAGGSCGRSGLGLAGAQGMVPIGRAVASAGVGTRGPGAGGLVQGRFEINDGQMVTGFPITNLVPGPKKNTQPPRTHRYLTRVRSNSLIF